MPHENKAANAQIIRCVIPPEYDGKPLADYLTAKQGFSHRTLTRLKKDPSYVLCNGVHLNLPQKVHAGDAITLTLPEVTYTLPQNPGSVPIVYEDDAIILYNKPPAMPVHPSRNHQQDTLANVFTADMQQRSLSIPFRAINRLDRDTSGLCLCAKSAPAAHQLAKAQQDGSLQKEYTAILCGSLPCASGVIEAPIGRPDPFYINRAVMPEGQYAKTAFRVLQKNADYTAVQVKLFTGRTHQIRVHFSAIGYPLAGDTLYSAGCKTDTDLSRHALCCSYLSFAHPVSGQQMTFSLSPRQEMRSLLAL